jgi:hypothetical protein
MNEFQKIEYIDAMYNTFDLALDLNYVDNLKLKIHVAYGILSVNEEGDYILEYVKKVNQEIQDNKIVEGLILPKGSLYEEYSDSNFQKNFTSKEGDKVSITWKDIVNVVNLDRRDCSVMETSGVVYRVYNDFILIKNPDTVRTYPLPIQSHPSDKPKFYVIPKSFILSLKAI